MDRSKIQQVWDFSYESFNSSGSFNNSCRNCQAVNQEIWVDKRRAEVIDTPYFHVVFTLPHELNSLIYCNQQLLYGLLHRCCARTLLELSAYKKHLGATPSIIQVLHTWNQEMLYHVHMHCIISGGGLTPDHGSRKSTNHFFIPVKVLRNKFRGKYLAELVLHPDRNRSPELPDLHHCVVKISSRCPHRRRNFA